MDGASEAVMRRVEALLRDGLADGVAFGLNEASYGEGPGWWAEAHLDREQLAHVEAATAEAAIESVCRVVRGATRGDVIRTADRVLQVDPLLVELSDDPQYVNREIQAAERSWAEQEDENAAP